MSSNPLERVKTRLDAVLEGENLTPEAVDTLCDVLTPEADGSWPDVETVLYVVERPAVKRAFGDVSAPQRLLQVTGEAIRAVAPLVERSPQFPLKVQVKRLRRAYDREKRKYDALRKKLADCDVATAQKIAAAYLETSPAPLFAERLTRQFDEIFADARERSEAGRRALTDDERLLELLSFEHPVDPEVVAEVADRLDEMTRRIGDVGPVVRKAASEGNDEEALVAGALAVRRMMSPVASALLSRLVQAKPFAAQMAAFSGWLTPSSTRHVLGRFLVDVLNDTSASEDREVDDDALRQSIVAARAVLPLIDSPIDDIEYSDGEAREVAQKVHRAWRFCAASRM